MDQKVQGFNCKASRFSLRDFSCNHNKLSNLIRGSSLEAIENIDMMINVFHGVEILTQLDFLHKK